jgi:hypothetical protein
MRIRVENSFRALQQPIIKGFAKLQKNFDGEGQGVLSAGELDVIWNNQINDGRTGEPKSSGKSEGRLDRREKVIKLDQLLPTYFARSPNEVFRDEVVELSNQRFRLGC